MLGLLLIMSVTLKRIENVLAKPCVVALVYAEACVILIFILGICEKRDF